MRSILFDSDIAHYIKRNSEPAGTTLKTGSRCAEIEHLEFEIISDRQGFDSLEADWNALFEDSGLPHQMFQTFNWNWHWCNSFLNLDRNNKKTSLSLCLVIARHKKKLVLVWPLVRDRNFGITFLRFMGAPVTQYGDVLVLDEPKKNILLLAAAQFIRNNIPHDALCLPKVRKDAGVYPVLRVLNAVKVSEQNAPYIPLKKFKDFDSYATRFSKRKLKTWNRLRRRLDEQGTYSFTCVNEGASAVEIMRQAFACKREWLKTHNLLSLSFSDKRFDEFFLAVAASTQRPVGLVASKISCGNRPAAMEIALSCKGHHAAHIGAMNREMQRFRPGAMQINETLRHCMAEEVDIYDFLAPADGYKTEWSESGTGVCDYVIVNSPKGQAYIMLYCMLLKPLVGKIKKALPGLLNGLGPLRKLSGKIAFRLAPMSRP